jgi:hypothetical protein
MRYIGTLRETYPMTLTCVMVFGMNICLDVTTFGDFIILMLFALILGVGWLWINDRCRLYNLVNSIPGSRMDPERGFVGTHVTWDATCKYVQGDIQTALLSIYDHLIGGCLSYDKPVRDKMIDMLTCKRLDIVCGIAECDNPAYYNKPCVLLPAGVEYMDVPTVYVCFANCAGRLSTSLAEGLAYIALYQAYGPPTGTTYHPDYGARSVKVGVDCG